MLWAGAGTLLGLGAARFLDLNPRSPASTNLAGGVSPARVRGSTLAAPSLPGHSPLKAFGGRFDLSRPARVLTLGITLHERSRAMQGIAYDTVNRRLFITQARDGRPGADLCINQVGPNGRVVAHLHLNNAGHGQSFGVEAVGRMSYLWLECDANENSSAGRGTALARFAFRPGVKPRVRKYFDDGVEVGCAIDPVGRRLLIRRPEDGATMFSLYALEGGTPGREPVARFAEPPAVYPDGAAPVLQSFTVLGHHAYVFIGTGGHAGTRDDPFDSYLSRIDMRTGAIDQQVLITAGPSLGFREPEGMGIDVVDGVPRLVFGFASRPSPRSSRRYANLFVNDAWS